MIRLLLIENDPQTRRAISRGLRARGYRVDSAASGEAALHHALAETPDGILLDLDVPAAGGAAKLVRLLRAWTVGPILLMTAPDREGDKLAALAADADDCVTKPFGMTELLDRLQAVLPKESGPDRPLPSWLETPDFALDPTARHACRGTRKWP